MKTPRLTDFDPEAKMPELKSSLQGMPAIQRPQRTTPPTLSPTPTKPEDKAPEASRETPLPDRPTARPSSDATSRPTDRPTGRRLLVRRGFEWYEDQLAALKKLSLEEQMEGRDGSMSAMVRQAVDDYLKKRRNDK
jgi:hypothetical protein